MKWRDEQAVQEALEAVTTAPDTALDEAILRAAYAGAEFREIASAAGMSLNMTYRRARRFRDRNAVSDVDGKPLALDPQEREIAERDKETA